MDNRQDNISSIDDLRLERRLLDSLRTLAPGQRKAVQWLTRCIDILDLIDSGQIMTEEMEQTWMKRAWVYNDDILMVLIQYKKVRDQARRNGSP